MNALSYLPPGGLMMLGALLLPLLPKRWMAQAAVALPVISFFHLYQLSGIADYSVGLTFFDQELTPIRLDRLR